MSFAEDLDRLKTLDHEIQLLKHTAAVLVWDQETYMPAGAVAGRAEQAALLQGMIHERTGSDEIAELLSRVKQAGLGNGDISSGEYSGAAFVLEIAREHDRSTKVPGELVRKVARTTSIAQAIWMRARKANDFDLFVTLLDEYGPVDDSFLRQQYESEKQKRFCVVMLERIGLEMNRGRMDVSAHPFTITLCGDDVRVTTWFHDRFLSTAVFGTIHEAGHAMYEMGMSRELHGTFLGEAASLGIHESQSRMWENLIGRSAPFWRCFYPSLRSEFHAQLCDVLLDQFLRAVNGVTPSLIRVEAVEVTYCLSNSNYEADCVICSVWQYEMCLHISYCWYCLHVILRFELETALVTGALQDIHWAMGSIGYFPTYALGNIYACQVFSTMRSAIPSSDELIAAGRFDPVLEWLRSRIHRYGRLLQAAELCRRVTGAVVNPREYVSYLGSKYGGIYGL